MTTLIDLTAAVVVVLGALYGLQRGASAVVVRFAGWLVGVLGGLLLADAVVPSDASPVTHLLLGLLLVLGCAIVGSRVVAGLASRISSPRRAPGALDRLAGAALYGTVAAAVCSVVLATVALLAPTGWSGAARESTAAQLLRPAGLAARTVTRDLLTAAPSDIAALVPATALLPSASEADAVAGRAGGSVVEVLAASACTAGAVAQGTGFAVGDGSLVVTNAHVVRGSSDVTLLGIDGRHLRATVIAFDPRPDLALLRLDGASLAPLTVGSDAANGTRAVVLGYPAGVRTVTPAAIVTRLPVPGPGLELHSAYVLDAPVRHGNSGSPLLDADGAAVGVVNALSDTDPDAGFAITASELRRVLADAPASAEPTPVPTGTCATEKG